ALEVGPGRVLDRPAGELLGALPGELPVRGRRHVAEREADEGAARQEAVERQVVEGRDGVAPGEGTAAPEDDDRARGRQQAGLHAGRQRVAAFRHAGRQGRAPSRAKTRTAPVSARSTVWAVPRNNPVSTTPGIERIARSKATGSA